MATRVLPKRFSSALAILALLAAGCAGPQVAESGISSGPDQEPAGTHAPPVQPIRPTNASWPDLEKATIRPGVMLEDCTAGFVFLDRNGTRYIGTAAHCFRASVEQGQQKCQVESKPLGAKIRIEGAEHPASLAYSSWLAMQAVNETDASICNQNDFALVRLDDRDAARVHPAVLEFGGPTGLVSQDDLADGEEIVAYGASPLTSEPLPRRKSGIVADRSETHPWVSYVYLLPPGIPGDLGGPVMTAEGQAIGIMTELGSSGRNSVLMLEKALPYAATHGPLDVTLATWSEFDATPDSAP